MSVYLKFGPNRSGFWTTWDNDDFSTIGNNIKIFIDCFVVPEIINFRLHAWNIAAYLYFSLPVFSRLKCISRPYISPVSSRFSLKKTVFGISGGRNVGEKFRRWNCVFWTIPVRLVKVSNVLTSPFSLKYSSHANLTWWHSLVTPWWQEDVIAWHENDN